MVRLVLISLLLAGCVDPYNPAGLNEDFHALVVDGFIDLDGSATVLLTRGMPLRVSTDPPVESGATVTIKSSEGAIFSLKENTPGTYSAAGLNVNKNSTYALRVVTKTNDKYQSDDVKIYSTPEIDSVYWTINGSNQLQISIDSHDSDPNSTGFYVANAIETYEYRAHLYSEYKFRNKIAIPRLPGEDVNICYREVIGHNTVATTKGLMKNILSKVIVSTIDRSSQKISFRYSALARLRAVSQEEYAFQKRVITSTEQTGTLFSQIPGTVLGNIHSVQHPGEYVLGYFRGQEVKERRYFISLYEHPLPDRFYQPPSNTCQTEVSCRVGSSGGGNCIPTYALGDDTAIVTVILEGMTAAYYVYTRSDCADCTIQGGTTKKPSFW